MSKSTKLEKKQERLELYYNKEKEILTNGVQAYGLGTRSITRYNADLSNVRAQIKELEKEIEELECALNGVHARKAMAVIPRDY